MSNYTQLGFVKQTDGENTGTWGDVLNENLIDLLDDAIGGYVEVSVASGNVTLAFADGTADNNGRHAVIKFTGSPGTTRTVTFPDAQVNYFIINGSDGSVICTSGSGAATVTIPTGMKDVIYVDGSDEVLSMFGTPHLSSSGNFTIDATTDIILDADGGDVFFKDGGTTFGSATNTSGNLIIKSGTTTAATFSGANVTLAGTVGSGAITSTGIVAATELDISGNMDIDGTSNLDAVDIDGAVQIDGTVTVGVDDTGLDVKFFGASAGAYALWDESENLLDLRGATAAGPGHLKLTTGELTVVDADVLGKIEFQAPLESDGSDAVLVGAAIWAEADDTFSGTVNNTDLVFALGKTAAASEKFRFTADNEIGIAGANYGTDGQVLTSGGAGAAVAWEDASAGAVTALNNATANELVTVGSTTTELDAEANLTFTGSALTCIGTITVGVDNTGHDVKFFGATSGSYWLWDEDADGVVQIGTLTVGVNDAGHDVKFFGDTASKYLEWDTSADTLNVAGTIAIPAGGAITNAGTMAPDITSTGKAMVLGF